MTTFQPDKNHCPQSCLCPMCQNDNECEDACEEYKQMAYSCKDKCVLCKIVKEEK
jgi:hypothetical protein